MNQVPSPADTLLRLLDLSRRAWKAGSVEELAFLLVNDTRTLAAYRQGALWFAEGGIEALSGVVEPEANAPYVHWLDGACRFLHEHYRQAALISAVQLPDTLAGEWADWLPPQGLWLPFADMGKPDMAGGLLLAADDEWAEMAIPLLEEWTEIWHHAWVAQRKPAAWSWPRLKREGGMNTRKYASLNEASRATAYRELADLVTKGCFVQIGDGRSTAYEIRWDADHAVRGA